MAYLGNINGPRESEILDKLGHSFFRCSPGELEEDISYHRFAESRSEIAPVHIDFNGSPYIEFSIKELKAPSKFILEEHGYSLKGYIKTFTEEEFLRWQAREQFNK